MYQHINCSLVVLFIFMFGGNHLKASTIMPNDDEYSISIEKKAEPIGGYAAIMKKLVYPRMAQQAGLEGKVYLLLYISETGEVDEVKLVKGIGGGCDESAMEAVKTCKFEPAVDKGAQVKSKLAVSLNFKLQK